MLGLQGRLALGILLAAISSKVQAATQTYCSSVNTAGSFSAIYGEWTSLSSCMNNCTAAGSYAFAVVQENNCWCSNYVPSPRVAVSQCDNACPGWPYENCGNIDDNLFGYLALGPAAAGTSGSSTSTVSATSAASSSTVITSQQTVISTSVSSQVTSSGSSTSVAPVTVLSTIATTERITVIPTQSSTSGSTTDSTSGSTSVLASVVTISGASTTKYITSVVTAPAAVATSDQLTASAQARSHSLSGGAIAGIVIGVLAGIALLAALIFFMCLRRRQSDDENTNTLDRNSSVLSKVGLVRKRANDSAPPSSTIQEITPSMTQRTPTLPFTTDSRMNPNLAGSWRGNTTGAGLGLSHGNDSQASLGSLQDARDYSRPLEVRNPDPV